MSDSVSLQIKGLEALRAKYDPAKVNAAASVASYAMAKEIENTLKAYPPATDSNRPGRFTPNGRPIGYYERNRGYWSPRVRGSTVSAYAANGYGKSRGVIRGSATQRKTGSVSGYVLTSSSETLGKKWNASKFGTGAKVTNSATYAPRVQGAKSQGAFFKRIGWITDAEAIKQAVAKKIFQSAFWQAFNKR